MQRKFRMSLLMVGAGLPVLAVACYASFVLIVSENFGKIGAVDGKPVFTSQHKGVKTGSVAPGGKSAAASGADTKTSAPQTLSPTLTDLQVHGAAESGLMFTGLESGNGSYGYNGSDTGDSKYLNDLALNIYHLGSGVSFSSGPFAPIYFARTPLGAGHPDSGFGPDAGHRGAPHPQGFLPQSGGNRNDPAAPQDQEPDAMETISVARLSTVGDGSGVATALPEPATLALLLFGIAGMLALRRWSR
jgi:hypothetical protein